MRYALIIILISLFMIFGCPTYLADTNVPWILRAMSYHFFHANIFHLLANCMSIWFVFSVTPNRTEKDNCRNFLTAYLIATLTLITATRPVVGVSNIIFAVIGLRSPELSHPWWKRRSTITFLGLTVLMLLVPRLSAITHITSFMCGVLAAYLSRWFKSIGNDYRRAAGRYHY